MNFHIEEEAKGKGASKRARVQMGVTGKKKTESGARRE